MKIDTYKINTAIGSNGQTKKDIKGAIDMPFSAYLNNEILARQANGPDLAGRTAIMPTGLPADTTLSKIQADAIAIGSNAIGALEHLSVLLMQPEIDGKALDQLADTLSRHIDDIKEARDNLAPNDPLKDILNSIGSISAVEAAKIKNGDY
ncbi:MAG: hypothetical protein ACP5J5_03985 [Dissulfurimicrobium sp.]|nr:hypothetical protein [Dissulfurimicrobium hydrothermale]UKL13734.1 hypothetical protein LGS26_00155 [Dissulfurimicrobium hydrothermale]